MSTNKRGRLRPTHEWDLLVPLFEWPEQKRYEEIRPLVLFDVSVAERAEEVGLSQSTLYRKLGGFEAEGMESLFASQTARKRKLPPTVRRFIVDLKAEHPPFNLNEIANVVQACFGRKPDVRSVARVLAEEPVPLKIVRNYPPYHEIADPREGRAAIVELRLSGWSAKAIAGYLGVHKATVYRALQRWKERGFEGLADGSPGRPPGVRKADFVAVEAIRKLAQNPGLGAFRVHAAMKQMRFDLSRATCGRILAMIREVYGYDEKPEGGSGVTQAAMPFAASARHEVWSADARHGAPKTLVTDSGSVFLANRARALYAKLGISKEEIEKDRPWQNYSETTFGIQQRMADWHFQKAQSWAELVEAHDRFVSDYNAQSHFAHQRREDGRRSPREVLSWVSGMRFHPRDLQRAFFSERFSRVLDASGYATLMRWRLYGEEALAGKEADLWLLENTLTLEHAGEPLSAYEVAHDAARSPDDARGRSGRLAAVRKPTLFETSYLAGQMRLFGLAETLGEEGWLKVLRLEDYAPRSSRQPERLQQVLFTYTDAI